MLLGPPHVVPNPCVRQIHGLRRLMKRAGRFGPAQDSVPPRPDHLDAVGVQPSPVAPRDRAVPVPREDGAQAAAAGRPMRASSRLASGRPSGIGVPHAPSPNEPHLRPLCVRGCEPRGEGPADRARAPLRRPGARDGSPPGRSARLTMLSRGRRGKRRRTRRTGRRRSALRRAARWRRRRHRKGHENGPRAAGPPG